LAEEQLSSQKAWRDKVRSTQGSLRVLSNERASSHVDIDEEEEWQDDSEDGEPIEPTSISKPRKARHKKSFLRSLWPFRR
jgi:hypothetical protein